MSKNQKKDMREYSKTVKETYTHDEVMALVEKRVEEELKAAREQWDKDSEKKIETARIDAEKMASMSDEERAKAELLKKENALRDERNEYMKERMEFEAIKLLADENLPIGFAKLLSGNNSNETSDNLDMFKAEFLKAIEEALAKRLKGQTPKTASYVETNDPFLAGFGC